MKPSMKMGMIALLGICVVFYQYHLSTGVRFDQVTAEFNGRTVVDEPNVPAAVVDSEACSNFHKLTEQAVRKAVHSIQLSTGLSPDVGKQLVQELIVQLSKANLMGQQEQSLEKAETAKADTSSPQSNVTSATLNSTAAEPAKLSQEESLDPLYIITPTYRRAEQIPELIRVSQALLLVKNVHWLVIEDAQVPTQQVTQLLNRTGLKFDHLVAPMPEKYKHKKGAKPRGVSNRNRGLEWIRANATRGVFYFADDDNTYDLDLFNEIRKTKRVSMFPVGLCTKFGLSSPIVRNGSFIGFYDGWIAGRKFPVDMAGFAVSVEFLRQRGNASMPYRAGFEEDGFLRSLAPLDPKDVELLGDNCTRILAWHTQTRKNDPSAPLDMKRYGSTNLVKLKQQIV